MAPSVVIAILCCTCKLLLRIQCEAGICRRKQCARDDHFGDFMPFLHLSLFMIFYYGLFNIAYSICLQRRNAPFLFEQTYQIDHKALTGIR
jgi:hypothetical protein